jgi:hypothetical protein
MGRMKRFTIRDLLLATTLIALGVGTWAVPWGLARFLSFPLIGGGAFTPFGKIRTGAFYGLAVSLSVIGGAILLEELLPGSRQR